MAPTDAVPGGTDTCSDLQVGRMAVRPMFVPQSLVLPLRMSRVRTDLCRRSAAQRCVLAWKSGAEIVCARRGSRRLRGRLPALQSGRCGCFWAAHSAFNCRFACCHGMLAGSCLSGFALRGWAPAITTLTNYRVTPGERVVLEVAQPDFPSSLLKPRLVLAAALQVRPLKAPQYPCHATLASPV